jgi:hypothetical protein
MLLSWYVNNLEVLPNRIRKIKKLPGTEVETDLIHSYIKYKKKSIMKLKGEGY